VWSLGGNKLPFSKIYLFDPLGIYNECYVVKQGVASLRRVEHTRCAGKLHTKALQKTKKHNAKYRPKTDSWKCSKSVGFKL
jgi:hypothetical protein